MIGLDYISDGLWRPADCYIGNQHGNMERIRHENRPVLIDKKTGLLLWPVEFVGLLSNPMALHKFPFDTDAIDILIHQNEASLGRDEYIFRPWPPAEEQALNAKEEWWEAKKAEEASQRASDAPVTTVAASDFGGTDYVSEAGGAQAQRSPRKPAGDGSAGGALNPRNMTTGQLKRELRARGVEPADDATRDVLRDTLVGLLGQERI